MAQMHTKEELVEILRTELPRLRQKYGCVRFGLFGSLVRGTATTTSDVDLLVELERPLGWEFVDLAEELEELLGMKVDIATFDAWRRSFNNPRRHAIAEDVERTLVYVK
jgi:hypothetical protein